HGGERQGRLKMLAKNPDNILDEKDITPEGKDQIVIGGSLVTGRAIKKAMEYGVKGIVAGGIIDKDLVEILGYDIGVAITGHEDIPLTIVITEGFGKIRMAEKTFHLLKELSGQTASINGATQIRAGVMRPEIIVAGYVPKTVAAETKISEGLIPGTPIRIIREPFFGELAEVVDLPPELQTIETEAHVRILKARLTDGREVTIPRANVEILEE
ncbi:MAG: hypothetical protein M1553_08085, partial [Firmicutes bacterium]|nr:hypothetical protein [Bacillota bacterium]